MSTGTVAGTDRAAGVGPWRALVRGGPVFATVIVVEALVQALLVAGDPTPELGWGFALLVVCSLAALLAAVWLVTGAAVAAVDGARTSAVARACWRRPAVLIWALGVGIVAVAVSIVLVWLTPVVLLAGSLALPPAQRGARPVLTAALRAVSATPLRAAAYLILAILLAAVSWLAALLFGLFVTGAAAAGLTWLWFGLVACVVLCLWSSLDRQASGVGRG